MSMNDVYYMDDSYLNGMNKMIKHIETDREKNTLITDNHIVHSGFVRCNDKTEIIMSEEFADYRSYEKSIDDKYFITISKGLSNIDHENGWTVHVDNCDRCTIGSIDIKNVHQYNLFMKALEISDKLNLYF